jgi:hypothetical protein
MRFIFLAVCILGSSFLFGQEEQDFTAGQTLEVWASGASLLRDENPRSPEILKLKDKEQVTYLGPPSKRQYSESVEGENTRGRYIKVKTVSNIEGWAFGPRLKLAEKETAPKLPIAVKIEGDEWTSAPPPPMTPPPAEVVDVTLPQAGGEEVDVFAPPSDISGIYRSTSGETVRVTQNGDKVIIMMPESGITLHGLKIGIYVTGQITEKGRSGSFRFQFKPDMTFRGQVKTQSDLEGKKIP